MIRLFISSKNTIRNLSRKVNRLSRASDSAWDKIFPISNRITRLEKELAINISHWGKYGIPARKKIEAKLEKATARYNSLTEKYETLRKRLRRAEEELEDFRSDQQTG